jgi:hypothetical protein
MITAWRRNAFTSIGKPEPLKYHLTGAWSRRIDDEHHLVHLVTHTEIIIQDRSFVLAGLVQLVCFAPVYPKVNAKAWAPGSGKVISKVRSVTGPVCRMSW